MSRYIDADALKETIMDMRNHCEPSPCLPHQTCLIPDRMVADKIDAMPTIDAVPVGAVEQIRWERDMAMQQLSEHGIPFGGKADDVIKVCRCKECQWFDANGDYYDSYCEKNGISVEEDFYCADGERRTE